MSKTDNVIVDAIDKPDREAGRLIEEEGAGIDKFSIDALAFWQDYLRQPKGRRAKLTKASKLRKTT